MKFTKTAIDKLEPKDKPYIIWDDNIKGFAVVVRPTGKKMFIFQSRLKGKKEIRITIGRYGNLTLEDAKEIAMQHSSDILKGIDPREKLKAKVKDERGGISLNEFFEIYKQRVIEPKINSVLREAKTEFEQKEAKAKVNKIYKNHTYNYDYYIKNILGEKPIGSINLEDIEKFTLAIKGQANEKRSLETTLNRCYACIRRLINVAIQWNYRPDGVNPVKHIAKSKEKSKMNFLTEKEVDRLYAVLSDQGLFKDNSIYAIGATKMLLLTGMRKKNIFQLKWDDLNLEEDYFYIKGVQTKNGKPLKVDLIPDAKETILSMPKIAGNPYVFCGGHRGRHQGHITEIRKVLHKALDLAGLGEKELRVHDLRHTYVSLLINSGVSLYDAGKIVGHSSIHTTQRYAHLETERLRKEMRKIEHVFKRKKVA